MSASAFHFHAQHDEWGDACLGMTAARAAGVEAGMVLQLARTPEGDAEVAQATRALSAPGRRLLITLDAGLSVRDCLTAVPEAALPDAMTLWAAGLVRTVSCVATSWRAPNGIQLRPLIDSILNLSADDLYVLLTQQAKRRLGLIHGFRVVLALERCVGEHEHRALALRFVESVWRAHGEAGLQAIARGLRA